MQGDVDEHGNQKIYDHGECKECDGSGEKLYDECEVCDGQGDTWDNDRVEWIGCNYCNRKGKIKRTVNEDIDTDCHCTSWELANIGHNDECKYMKSKTKSSEGTMNIEELIKLADLLDSHGEHDAANKIDGLIKAIGEDEDYSEDPTMKMTNEPTMKDPGEYGETMKDPGEYGETMTMEPEREGPTEDELDQAYRDFRQSPRRFENVHRLKKMIDKYVGEFAEEDVSESSASLNVVFEKLAKVADSLDSVGARDEANMIDSFINKHAINPEHPDAQYDPPTVLSAKLHHLMALAKRYHGVGEADAPVELLNDLKSVLSQALAAAEESVGEKEDLLESQQGLGPAAEEEMAGMSEELQRLESTITNRLSKIADDVVDWKDEDDSEQKKRYDDRYHHELQTKEPKSDKERVDREGRDEHHVDRYKSVEAHSLSTRYCPDHVGTQMGRVGQGSFQCPLDGQVYNWETGWTDFDGNQHPGGSVAAQTPDSTGYAIPHRIFDSREKVLNVVN
jgi:hypothetical protein